MTEHLWHGNDDPPQKAGTQIEYILDGEHHEGTYRTGGYISRGKEGDRLRIIDHIKQVTQWRLA